jgi:phasin family protein
MAKASDKTGESAEKAYAAAAAEARPVAPAKLASAAKAAPARKRVAKKAPVKKPATKPAAKPAAVAKAPEPVAPVVEVPELATPVVEVLESIAVVVEAPEPVAAVVEAPVPAAPQEAPAPIAVITPKPTITELKEKIMATAKTNDFTKPVADAIGEIQTRAKAAYEKGTEALTEATEFAKGNVEAIVESGKIYAAGVQDLGKTYVDEAKSAYEAMTADLKEIAAIKSPTELFQLQGKIMRRNFDALVSTGSKNTEAFVKLANDTFAPISGRVNLAAEKLAKVA